MTMLSIKQLHAHVQGKEILRGLNLEVGAGEVHAIMGPNGSGKSTLASVLAGKEGYDISSGSIHFLGKNLLDMSPEARAGEGLFLAFQYPVEIPGLSSMNFLKTALREIHKYRGEPPLSTPQFLARVKSQAALVGMDAQMLKRPLNEGFSGGEKKRHEILQMALLTPRLSILDETDSGLDIDALRIVSKGVNALRNNQRAVVLITHYQRLLNYVVPDKVHVLYEGRILSSGDKTLALQLEEKGYDTLVKETTSP